MPYNPITEEGASSTLRAINELIRDDYDKVEAREFQKSLEESTFYKRQHKMRSKWTEREIDDFINEKIRLLFSVMESGIREPLLIRSDNKIIDGGHRLLMWRVLGRKGIIVRIGVI